MNLMPLSSRVICIFLAFSLSSTLALGQAGPRPEKKKNRCTVCLHHPKLMEDFAFHHGSKLADIEGIKLHHGLARLDLFGEIGGVGGLRQGRGDHQGNGERKKLFHCGWLP